MKSNRSRIRHAKKRGHRVSGWLEILTDIMELVIAVIVMVGFTMGIVPLIRELPSLLSFDGSGEGTFHVFLEHAFNLVIGIEFIRMLIRHTPGSALEVLMFALARHLVLSGGSGAELLFSVAAIGGVFAIRKYLMISGFEAEDEDAADGDAGTADPASPGDRHDPDGP